MRIASTLCLLKFMVVSESFCKKQLPLLLTILQNTKEAIIRNNITISMGDIIANYHHVMNVSLAKDDQNKAATSYMEIWSSHILEEKDIVVMKNGLLVLVHLNLNGMIKIKSLSREGDYFSQILV